MMEQQYILSIEELCFSLTYCGYDGIAIGMLKGNLGEISEEAMEFVLQTAARSLHTKGILRHLNEDELESSFVDGFKEILDDLATSKYFLRCYNETEYGEFVLTAHKGRNGFVYHLVSNEIVHILNYIDKDRFIQEITGFFNPVFQQNNINKFLLSESQFQQLMEELQRKDDSSHVLENMPWLKKDQSSVEKFIGNYLVNGGKIVNLSLIFTEEDALPTFSEVYLLLLTDEQVWTIRNINENKEQEPILTIETIQEQEWIGIIDSLISLVKEY